MIGKPQVAEHDRAAADRAMGTDHRAAGHADAAGHGRVLAHVNVVADLNQVVELDAVLDHRVFQRTAVDAGVRADLHVVADAHCAQLFDLHPGALVRRQTEAVRTDHDARMQQAARADRAVFAHGHARFENSVGTDARTALHHAQCADSRSRVDMRLWVDDCTGMHARGFRSRMGALPELREPSEIKIRVGRDDEGTALGGLLPHRGRHDDARCL